MPQFANLGVIFPTKISSFNIHSTRIKNLTFKISIIMAPFNVGTPSCGYDFMIPWYLNS